MSINRRQIIGRTALLAALAPPVARIARAQSAADYPSRPVKLVVPFVPGGNVDSTSRIFTEALSKILGQNFIVENRGGANGMIGAAAVARSEPDGYTLLGSSTGPLLAAWQLVGKSAQYSLDDLRVVAVLNTTPNVIVVNENSAIKNFGDLLRISADRSGSLKWGHPGNSTSGHVSIIQFQKASGADHVVAGYKGAAPAVQDLLGGQLDVVATDLPAVLQLLRAGNLRAIAVTSDERTPFLPDVPTMKELGKPEASTAIFTAIMAPKAAPDAVVARVSEGVRQALASPAVQKQLADIGTSDPGMTPAEFANYLQREAGVFKSLVQSGQLQNE